MLITFNQQLYRTGFVHCDPHPGNILIRSSSKGPPVVLLDHGLYVQCTPEFTKDYAVFWKSLFSLDMHLTRSVTEKWGIVDPKFFASATLARPWHQGERMNKKPRIKNLYQAQMEIKDGLNEFLKNSEKMPKELIFVGRNLKLPHD